MTTATKLICPSCGEKVESLTWHHWKESDGSCHFKEICGSCNSRLTSAALAGENNVFPPWEAQVEYIKNLQATLLSKMVERIIQQGEN